MLCFTDAELESYLERYLSYGTNRASFDLDIAFGPRSVDARIRLASGWPLARVTLMLDPSYDKPTAEITCLCLGPLMLSQPAAHFLSRVLTATILDADQGVEILAASLHGREACLTVRLR